MKTLIAALVLSLINQLAVAQKNFEGKIIYRIIKPSDENNKLIDSTTVTAYFGLTKIKASIDESFYAEKEGDSTVLIDFAKGKCYMINPYKHRIKEKKLKNSNGKLTRLTNISSYERTILNASASAFIDEGKPNIAKNANFSPIYWYADTIYYKFDTTYSTSRIVSLFGNGKTICLGRKEIIGEGNNDKYNFLWEAISIQHMSFPDSLFKIPSGFTDKASEERDFESGVVTDSINLKNSPKKGERKKSPTTLRKSLNSNKSSVKKRNK